MFFLFPLLFLISFVSEIDASQPSRGSAVFTNARPPSLTLSVHHHSNPYQDRQVKNNLGHKGEEVELELQEAIRNYIRKIESMTEGADRKFWMKIVAAHGASDVEELGRLQNERKPNTIEEQTEIIEFICSAQSARENKVESFPLPTMKKIEQSSFFRQITKK